jgi:hypothetical protein
MILANVAGRAKHLSTDRMRQAHCCVVAAITLLVACGPEATPDGQRRGPPEAMKIDDVRITDGESGLMFQYHTRTSSRDCDAQAAEMPTVWKLVVDSRLSPSHPQRVILVPEDPSGWSVGFEFTKSASGQWSAAAPCRIGIPIVSAPRE